MKKRKGRGKEKWDRKRERADNRRDWKTVKTKSEKTDRSRSLKKLVSCYGERLKIKSGLHADSLSYNSNNTVHLHQGTLTLAFGKGGNRAIAAVC